LKKHIPEMRPGNPMLESMDQRRQNQDWDRHDDQHGGNKPQHENPVRGSRLRTRHGIFLQQSKVPQVALPRKIKDISQEGNGSSHHVNHNVQDHSGFDHSRQTHPESVCQ
jgi:hypothetical protein